jgi:hypothetical protein
VNPRGSKKNRLVKGTDEEDILHSNGRGVKNQSWRSLSRAAAIEKNGKRNLRAISLNR